MILYVTTPICYSSEERIEYFRKYIDHVNRLNNLNKIHFLFFVEPNSENMVDMIPNHWNKTIFRNYYRFKPSLNHYVAFNYCFDVLKLEFTLLLEDDIIVSPDIYNLIKYCLNFDSLDENALCLLNKHKLFNPSHNIYSINSKELLIHLKLDHFLNFSYLKKMFWGLQVLF